MGERDDARRSIEEARHRMSEIADELSYRASPQYLKGRVRDVATRKGREWGERAKTSPMAYGVIGGTVGTLVGLAMKKREEDRWYDSRNDSGNWGYGRTEARYYGESDELPGYAATGYGASADYGRADFGSPGYESRSVEVSLEDDSGPGMKEKASAKMGELKEGMSDTASHVKERMGHAVDNLRDQASHLRERASGVREHIPSRHEMSHRARSYYQDSLHNQPLLLAAGALALGALASMLIPVTDKERRAIGPVRERAKEQLSHVASDVKHRVQDVGERVKSEVKSAVESSDKSEKVEEKSSESQTTSSYGQGSTIPELPPLH